MLVCTILGYNVKDARVEREGLCLQTPHNWKVPVHCLQIQCPYQQLAKVIGLCE